MSSHRQNEIPDGTEVSVVTESGSGCCDTPLYGVTGICRARVVVIAGEGDSHTFPTHAGVFCVQASSITADLIGG